MAIFQSFVGAVRDKVVDIVSQRMEQGGSQAVSYAKDLVPVKTGQLQASIGYYWSRDEMRLTLFADRPYALWVERRKPYLRPALGMIGQAFGIARLDIQFPSVPGKYQSRGARLLASKHPIIVGGRNLVRVKH